MSDLKSRIKNLREDFNIDKIDLNNLPVHPISMFESWIEMAIETEKEAIEEEIDYEVSVFPWAASGRALASNCSNGMTKLIWDKDSKCVIGGAVVGSNAGELLGEIGLAIEMGCNAEDLALTIHAHPTLHESIGLTAELFEGSITDLPNPKAKK